MDWLENLEVDEPQKRTQSVILEGQPEIQEALWFEIIDVSGFPTGEKMTLAKSCCDYLFFQKKYAEALQKYQDYCTQWAKSLNPKEKVEATESIIYCHLYLKQDHLALPLILELLRTPQTENDQNLWFLLSKVYKHSNERFNCIQKCLTINYTNILAWYHLGLCYEQQGKHYWAHLAFEKTLYHLTRDRYFRKTQKIAKGDQSVRIGNQYLRLGNKIHDLIRACPDENKTEGTAGMGPFELEYLMRANADVDEEEDDKGGASNL